MWSYAVYSIYSIHNVWHTKNEMKTSYVPEKEEWPIPWGIGTTINAFKYYDTLDLTEIISILKSCYCFRVVILQLCRSRKWCLSSRILTRYFCGFLLCHSFVQFRRLGVVVMLVCLVSIMLRTVSLHTEWIGEFCVVSNWRISCNILVLKRLLKHVQKSR